LRSKIFRNSKLAPDIMAPLLRRYGVFTARCTIVQSAVLSSCRPPVCQSVCPSVT